MITPKHSLFFYVHLPVRLLRLNGVPAAQYWLNGIELNKITNQNPWELCAY